MITAREATIPAELVDRALLAVPAGGAILDLAAVRFPDARWLVTPEQAAERSRPIRGSGGARFRGVVAEAQLVHPELALEPGLVLVGPFRVGARDCQALGLLGVEHDLFALPALGEASASRTTTPDDDAAPAGETGPDAAAAHVWALVAARHSWGAVIEPDGEVVRPDPDENVGMRLFSPDPQPLEVVLGHVRHVIPTGTVRTNASGAQGIVAPMEYDGAVLVQVSRAATQVPVALKTVDWREYGPHVYSVEWLPPAELATGEPAALFVIARQRAALVVARVATQLQRTLTGTVLDDDDVRIDQAQLALRLQGRRTA